MKTYIYTETASPARGYDTRITVYRVRRNQPHKIGHTDCNTATWYGVHGEAIGVIHDNDGIPYAKRRDGSEDRYELRGELCPSTKYDDRGRPRNAVRVFGI